MKICKKCFAEYADQEVQEKYQFCIECYGECLDTVIVDKAEFLQSVTQEELVEQKQKISVAPITDYHKNVLVKRIEKLIEQKNQK